MYIDTHTHLYDDQLINDPEVIPKAIASGVTKMYLPNCDSATIAGMLQVADKWPDHCFPMMGLHPCYVKENYREELAIIAAQLQNRKYYAVGETGLDYYWDITHKTAQTECFKTQIDWALQYDLPIVIHSRESTKDCIEIVRQKQDGTLRGIFHCFSGTLEEAKKIIDLGLHLGIGGTLTYKKSNLREIVQQVSPDYIVLETDAPYLAPSPYRGKRNESSYIPIIAVALAQALNLPIEEIAIVTTRNAEKVFNNG